MNRIQTIQKILDKIQGEFYLEIGVDKGESFKPIQAPLKVGVDPFPKFEDSQVRVMESDDFFAQYEEEFGDKKIDVCFIDGMHSYEQTYKDVNNALKHLSDKGYIVMHDCSPPLAVAADPKQ